MPVPRAQQRIHAVESLGPLLVVLLVTGATSGCKTGATSAKPSWWTFGGGDPAKIASASAPPAGGIEKPSANAKPYPVTSTPQSYSLATASQAAAGGGTPAAASATPPTVTYGSTPPPRAAAVATAPPVDASRTASVAQPAPLNSIAPQVGPYASLPGESQAVAAGGLNAAAAPAAGDPAGGRFRSPPPERYADAKPSDTWSAPASSPAGSRFGGGQQPVDVSEQAPAARAAGFTTVDQSLPSAGSLQGAAVNVMPEPSVGPTAAPAAPLAPAVAPASSVPQPTRRPDPMYRPAGTSSYRPGREILVGGDPAADAAVRQVNFEAPPPAN